MIPGDSLTSGALEGRRIRFWTALGSDVFQLVSFRGCEALSALYSFQLRFRTLSQPQQTFNSLLGTSAVIEIELPNPNWENLIVGGSIPQLAHRRFCGILASLAQTHQDELYTYFRGTLVPQLWQKKLGATYRAFHQQDTQEIVASVLQGLAIRWELSQSYAKRNYTVQYGESDFAFVSRLLEEDGLFYFFEHTFDGQPEDSSEARERLVICDSVERLLPLPNQDTFAFDAIRGGNRSSMRIRRFAKKVRLVAPTIDARDRHFQLPTQPVIGTANIAANIDLGGEALQTTLFAGASPKSIYPADYAYRFDDVSPSGAMQADDLQQIFETAQRDANLRAERLTCSALDFSGISDVAAMTPGFLFQMRDGVRTGQPYYLTEVRHCAQLSNSQRSGNDVPYLQYKNRFRCLPKTVTFRPARIHRKRQVWGLVSGLVVNDPSVSEDQVCVDRYGRIKVRFPWQSDEDIVPSCWIRVSQLWAGNRWGAFFWPRVGHEVLVAFEHGDPERPIVVGSVYNTENMPPLVLPKYKLSCGIHSCSHQGNPLKNYNAVVFHDQPDCEFLQLHSETFECLTSETESLHHSAGKSLQVLGHNSFFDLISDISGMGGGEEEGNDGTRARFGFKGRAGKVIGILQFLGILPRAGTVEIIVGAKIDKIMGREWLSCFGPVTHFIFDLKAIIRKAIEDKIPMGGAMNSVARFLIGPGSASGETSIIIGEDHKVIYGSELVAHHGADFKVSFEPGESIEPHDNTSIILVGVGDFAKLLMKIMGIFDLLMAIVSKILLEVGGSGADADSYTRWSDLLECITSIVMPKLTSILVKSQVIGARLQMGTQTATEAVEESKAFFNYVLSRGASPGFQTAITEELANVKYVSAKTQISAALSQLAAALNPFDFSDLSFDIGGM